MKPILIIVFFVAVLTFINAYFFDKMPYRKVPNSPSIWIDWWHPKDSTRGGHYYNDCIKLNENKYLYVGKDYQGNTFDSSIITVNK